jgi:hypothetical protein
MKIRTVGAKVFHADRHVEATSRFPQFCEHDIGEGMLAESCRWLSIVRCRRTGRLGKKHKQFNFRRYPAGTNKKSHASNIVARSRNHCYSGNTPMHSVCVVESHVTASCIKMGVAQQCFYCKLTPPATMQITWGD